MSKRPAIHDLLRVMARLRGPGGCPWDHQQNHRSLRFHAVEEVYELLDAIEADDDQAMEEELGDLLFSVVNLARFRKSDPEVLMAAANSKFEKRFGSFLSTGVQTAGRDEEKDGKK